MNNTEVQKELDNCQEELQRVKSLIVSLGFTADPVPYLTKYTIIRACGAVEQAFKAIVADYCTSPSIPQVKLYLTITVRESSSNPTYQNICRLLRRFDKSWHTNFKATLAAEPDKTTWRMSLQSLVDARNSFAHGGSPSATITDVITYFLHARQIIEKLDAIVV